MNYQKNPSRLKRTIYGLIVFFILIFLSGFFSLGGKALLAIDLLFLALGAGFIVLVFKSKVGGKLKGYLLLTGFSSVVFSIGLAYGIFGIWDFYLINDPIYLSSVIVSWAGFLIGVIGSIVMFNSGGGQDAASVVG